MGAKDTGTVVVAPGTVESAIAGGVILRTWDPEVIGMVVGTECRPSAITCRFNCLNVWSPLRSYVRVAPSRAAMPRPGCHAVLALPSSVVDAVALRSPGSRP